MKVIIDQSNRPTLSTKVKLYTIKLQAELEELKANYLNQHRQAAYEYINKSSWFGLCKPKVVIPLDHITEEHINKLFSNNYFDLHPYKHYMERQKLSDKITKANEILSLVKLRANFTMDSKLFNTIMNTPSP